MIYKVLSIWGKAGLNESIKALINYMKNEYNPNRDCIEFLKNNGKEYKDNYRNFNNFFEDEVKPELDDMAKGDWMVKVNNHFQSEDWKKIKRNLNEALIQIIRMKSK